MALNFPNTPADGDRYEAPNGATYQWNGTYNYWELVGTMALPRFLFKQPPTALPGQLWWDSAAGELYILMRILIAHSGFPPICDDSWYR